MRIVAFLQHYHTPDCSTAGRPYALVKRLGEEHEVTVITTRAWEETRHGDRFPWVPPGVDLVRFDVPYNNTMSTAERATSFLKYAVHAVRYGLQMPKPDLILGSSTPLTAAAAAGLVAYLRDVPWIFEVRDLWPAFPIQMGAVPDGGLHHLLRWGEATLYRNAAHVVTGSPDMEQHVRARAPSASVTTLMYGADLTLLETVDENDEQELSARLSSEYRFLVLYAGTLGRANAVPTVIDAARQLTEARADVLVALAGRGYHEPLVAQAARQHDAIQQLPPLPHPETLALFKRAEVSLVPFIDRPVLAANSPGKFFDSLATGTPVVVTNPGWTKRFVERHDCGWYVPPGSPDLLATQIQSVLDSPDGRAEAARNARAAAQQHFDRENMLDRYAVLVEEVGDPRRTPAAR